jgi:tetratricopeptide (TPR) repeat protein
MTVSKAERAFHRKTGARCFNEAWKYLEKAGRNASDNRRLLNLVHASRFHWGLVGTPRNQAVGDWQISRAYAALGRPELALQFARSSLELCRKNDLSDLEGTAYEAVARAYAVAKDPPTARKYLQKARERLEAFSVDAEDREIFLGQIRDTERLIER